VAAAGGGAAAGGAVAGGCARATPLAVTVATQKANERSGRDARPAREASEVGFVDGSKAESVRTPAACKLT
jgi:hypothetical protein